jgi:signal peptidase I
MYCPKCGAEHVEGVPLCADCGTAVTATPPAHLKTEKAKRRRPYLAFFLSFFFRGLGQLYNGQLKRAVVFFSIEFVLTPILWILAPYPWGSFGTSMLSVTIGLALSIAYIVFVAVDAYKGASRIRELKLRRYNRWYIYLAIILACYSVDRAFELLGTGNLRAYFKTYKISSFTMEPSLLVGDYLMCDLRYYRSHNPQRGDLVVFLYPKDKTKVFVRRVIAVEGESVDIRNKVVYVNGQKIEDPWGQHLESGFIAADLSPRDNTPPIRVPDGSVFVLGDNRNRSLDSRFFGPVSVKDIKAKPLYLYWAKDWSRIGMRAK